MAAKLPTNVSSERRAITTSAQTERSVLEAAVADVDAIATARRPAGTSKVRLMKLM